MATSKAVQSRIITFLLFTFAFSSIFYYHIISAGTLSAGGGLYVLGLMWCPGFAALATQALYERSLRALGWRWGMSKYQLWSYAIPFLYALAAYAIVWGTGLGGFYNPELVSTVSAQLLAPMGLEISSPYAIIAAYVLFLAVVGVAQASIVALGEEIGWRGFLVPHLAQITTFSKTALVSGVIWAVWHFPILLFADYNAGTPAWYALSCFTVMVVGISFAYTWLRLRSGSLWTAVFLHASHNVFVQGVFTPLTRDTGPTKYVIDEFGAGLAFMALVVAYVFWRKRSELESVGDGISPVRSAEPELAVARVVT